MAKECRNFQTEILSLVVIMKVNLMAKEFILKIMEISMMAILLMAFFVQNKL